MDHECWVVVEATKGNYGNDSDSQYYDTKTTIFVDLDKMKKHVLGLVKDESAFDIPDFEKNYVSGSLPTIKFDTLTLTIDHHIDLPFAILLPQKGSEPYDTYVVYKVEITLDDHYFEEYTLREEDANGNLLNLFFYMLEEHKLVEKLNPYFFPRIFKRIKELKILDNMDGDNEVPPTVCTSEELVEIYPHKSLSFNIVKHFLAL